MQVWFARFMQWLSVRRRVARARARYAKAEGAEKPIAAGTLLLALQDVRLRAYRALSREDRMLYGLVFTAAYADRTPRRSACELHLILARYAVREDASEFARMEVSEAIAEALAASDPLLLANIRREWESFWPERFTMLDAASPELSSL